MSFDKAAYIEVSEKLSELLWPQLQNGKTDEVIAAVLYIFTPVYASLSEHQREECINDLNRLTKLYEQMPELNKVN